MNSTYFRMQEVLPDRNSQQTLEKTVRAPKVTLKITQKELKIRGTGQASETQY
jgi:hypothetical protein